MKAVKKVTKKKVKKSIKESSRKVTSEKPLKINFDLDKALKKIFGK